MLVVLLGTSHCSDRPERTALRIQPMDAGGPSPSCAIATTPSCGDPCADGVVVNGDVTENTVWDCPVYTLPGPVYVEGTRAAPARLVIAPGTRIRGRRGDVERGQLPGVLIVTRSGRLEARGTSGAPIVFTSSEAPGARQPGDWGGIVLLGSAPINTPADFESSGNRAGVMFVEGLPRDERTSYGALEPEAADAGADAGDSGIDAGDAGPPLTADPDHECGHLRFVRIEFAGFEVGDNNELNGLTVAGCGRATELDHIQVHLGSDDGIEFFGGNADLTHAVLTDTRDDALDWDQGWVGRVQFLAIRQNTAEDAEASSDNAMEGDGFADPERAEGVGSAPVMRNVTVLSGRGSTRGLRLREGTGLQLASAIIAADASGATAGLIELGDALTADQLTLGRLRVNNTILAGAWPLTAREDSRGNRYLEADYFTIGDGAAGNSSIDVAELGALLPGAFDPLAPHWVPPRGSLASRGWAAPAQDRFFDDTATYRGAFDPAGADWTQGWTAYPQN